MATREIVWQVPEGLYHELVAAQQELAYPELADLIAQAVQRYLAEIKYDSWWSEFRELQKQVRASGGFKLGETKEEVIARLREQRREIFDTDYAGLY